MLVIIDKYPLDTSLFRNCIINERLNLVYFIHRPKGMEGELQLPILFENACDTRRFYTEYRNAVYNDDPQYEFKGEAWFSLELYIRLRDENRN
jgi:hypothetical protein